MSKVRSYRDLIVWQMAMKLTKAVYHETRTFPNSERYGIVSQIRRAAVSVSSNIAEGQSRNSTREFLYFLGIAKGSLAELETLIQLASSFKYMEEEESENLLLQSAQVNRLLWGLQKSLPGKAIH